MLWHAMTKNGYEIVNIIQKSTIFIFPVSGSDWDIPMKLKMFLLIYKPSWDKLTMLLEPKGG